MQTHNRIGYYCWGGPGTIRMIDLKYFGPKMDRNSILSSYDFAYLQKLKETFHVTDFWATYSWGFSDEREKEDRKYLIERLPYFKKLGIKVHAYIQGPNVVYEDFKDKDWFCVDEKERLISYHRGRKLTCLNNPDFKEYLMQKVEHVCKEDVDGIFIDNIQMGQLGVPKTHLFPFVFYGCACAHCKTKFKKQTGHDIPKNLAKVSKEVQKKYQQFRVSSTNEFLKDFGDLVHSYGKEFGTNSFDPQFDTSYCYGTDLAFNHEIQDYLLFENHSVPNFPHVKNNLVIQSLRVRHAIKKPIFVVSYKKGIGFDKQFTQQDIDHIYTEAAILQFSPCVKGSEYYTNGIWHNLDIFSFKEPLLLGNFPIEAMTQTKDWKTWMYKMPFLRYVLRNIANPLMTWYMEKRAVRKILERMHIALMK